ncbi:phosphotransferase family protein [Vagococcus vulneris]|uniref:phosphotransferase family protein n=1 Tax=Vagococcus vulneris TaxID=1977869 RepID=UPI0023E8D518|nr:phosphotransferase family protein [Vagococcus vulneris]
MIFKFDKNWNLQPLKGDTGKAYKGIKDGEKVFLKRNSTPFLAALSREGLTPKLLWTKRMGNGDIVTAQEWLDGQQLSTIDMVESTEVIRILNHLHQSESLRSMLKRMGGHEKSAFDFLRDYVNDLPIELKNDSFLLEVFRYLEDHLPTYDPQFHVACHGDVMHKNWVQSIDGTVFLVDWDYSILADPALDFGSILGCYLPREEWSKWLERYGENPNDNLLERVKWYAAINLLLQIKRSYLSEDLEAMEEYLELLRKIELV